MNFDYAISFSSAQRDFARKLSQKLTAKGYRIFFDENFEHELLGKDGVDYLNNIFFKQSKYCVAILSETYEKSAWTQLEKRAVQAREFASEPGYLIPVLIKGFKPDWLLPTRIYFDLDKRGSRKLLDLLCKKIELDYYGPFKITKEIEEFSDIRAFSITATDNNEYILWSGYVQGEPLEIRRLLKNRDGNWITQSINIKARGRFVFLYNHMLLACDEYGDEPFSIFWLNTNESRNVILPRNAKWRSITDCKFDGENIYFAFCGGGGWVYSLYTQKSTCIQKDEDNTDYAKICTSSTQIIIGVRDEISIYGKDFKLIERFNAPDYIGSIDYNQINNQLIIGGNKHIYFIDLDTKNVIFKHQILAQFTYTIKSSTTSNIVIGISGLPNSSNVLEILDAKTKTCFGQIDSGRYSCWYDIAISKDGQSFVAFQTNTFNFDDPGNKLVVFERMK